jgi:hypothetical protein
MEEKRPLIDFSDREVKGELRRLSPRIEWSYAAYREELFRRSQDRNTRALNRWTAVIVVATAANVIATLILRGW